jgi:hypothetical protein
MARKPATRVEFILFDVVYADGSQRSNRRVQCGLLPVRKRSRLKHDNIAAGPAVTFFTPTAGVATGSSTHTIDITMARVAVV